MCPVCFATVAMTVIATASGSALTVFVAKTLRVPVPVPSQSKRDV
jgi:uncharacterized membrane protein